MPLLSAMGRGCVCVPWQLRIAALLGQTAFRVSKPDLVLLSAIIVGWRYLLAERKRRRLEARRSSANKLAKPPDECAQGVPRTRASTVRRTTRLLAWLCLHVLWSLPSCMGRTDCRLPLTVFARPWRDATQARRRRGAAAAARHAQAHARQAVEVCREDSSQLPWPQGASARE